MKRIENKLSEFTSAERRVADWVLGHPRQASAATLADVARAAGASEPTVIRFSRRLGLSGFRELSRWLAAEVSRPAGFVHRDVGPDDTIADVVSKVLDASIQALVDTRSEMPAESMRAAVELLGNARQIVFAGLGASGHVAGDACHKFFRLGIPASTVTDLPGILQLAAIVGPGDALVFVSARGAWDDLNDAAEHARQRGAAVIAVTDPDSGLARRATAVLECRLAEDTSVYTPMSSRLAQLALLDALQVSLALALGDAASERLEASKRAIANRIGR